jgi:hypothetical protein
VDPFALSYGDGPRHGVQHGVRDGDGLRFRFFSGFRIRHRKSNIDHDGHAKHNTEPVRNTHGDGNKDRISFHFLQWVAHAEWDGFRHKHFERNGDGEWDSECPAHIDRARYIRANAQWDGHADADGFRDLNGDIFGHWIRDGNTLCNKDG